MKTARIFGLLAVVAVAIVLVAGGPFLLGQGTPHSVQLSTQASQSVSNGLRLDLSISESVISAGQPLIISVDSYNPSDTPLNVTAGKDWALQGLRTGSCPSSFYPFGVAVYEGRYAAGNVSEARPLQIFPNVPCPLFIRLVTGYYFDSDSSNATVLPGTGSSISISATITVTGTYSGAGAAAQPLPAGTYTVVAGDEWGTLVFLEFQVR